MQPHTDRTASFASKWRRACDGAQPAAPLFFRPPRRRLCRMVEIQMQDVYAPCKFQWALPVPDYKITADTAGVRGGAQGGAAVRPRVGPWPSAPSTLTRRTAAFGRPTPTLGGYVATLHFPTGWFGGYVATPVCVQRGPCLMTATSGWNDHRLRWF